MLDIIRVVHDLPEGVDPAADARRWRLLGYLDAVAQFEQARLAWRAMPVTLERAADKGTRKSLEALARAWGASLEHEKRIYRMQPGTSPRDQQRREWLLAAGVDVATLEATLNGGGSVTLDLAGDEVPLPLPEGVWRSLPVRPDASGRAAETLVAAILGDRKASLLYYGLTSMDEQTRAYLAATPALIGEIYESGRAGTLALYGRSLHVSDGRVITPGPPAASALWEALADERVTRPDRFLVEVLGRDEGRLALLYDAVAHMDAPGQAFALGVWLPDGKERVDRFKALYASCAPALAGWNPTVRPFVRSLYDPAQLLLLTGVLPDGRPAGPAWRRLWEKIYEGDDLPDGRGDDLKDLEKDGLADAAWLVGTILQTNIVVRRHRAEAWLFAQRVFGRVPLASMPDVFVAMRGFGRFRTLADTLERLGITAPEIYAQAFRQAQRISDIGDRERTATALALYQGALVLIERACLGRVLDVATAGRLVSSLSQVPMSEDGEYLGGIATWIDIAYLPAIGRPAGTAVGIGDAAPMESDVLGAFSGRRADGVGSPDRTFEYQGIEYRLDPAAPELLRMQDVRVRQRGPSLDQAMGFARAVLAIAAGVPDASVIPAQIATLEAAARPLVEPRTDEGARERDEDREFTEAVDDAAGDLRKIRAPKDLAKVERIAVPLRRGLDRRLGQVLTSLAYAYSLGDPENSALVAGDPSRQHDWGLDERDDRLRLRAPWTMPAQGRDESGRWRVSGSLLALDVGLGEFTLRRISSEAPLEPPTITENDQHALTEAVVLADVFAYRDDDMTAVAEALDRGRARIAALASASASVPDVIADAALDDTRRELLPWTLAHERDRVPVLFSAGDLLALGRVPRASADAFKAWGTSSLSFDGCPCLRLPASGQWTSLSGRRGMGLLATFVPDVSLLIAESLHQRGLPAALTRPLLAVATQDVIERVHLAHDDDWMAMTSDVQGFLPARMDDYLASVITGGQLTPVSKGSDGARIQ